MGKGSVIWLALGTAILTTLVGAAPAAARMQAGAGTAPSAASGPSTTGGEILGTVSATTPERAMLRLINNARLARGLHRLNLRTSLYRAANAHSVSMLRLNYFSHTSSTGETFARRIRRYGYSRSGCSYWSVGEVIGWGAGSTYGSTRAIFKAWMRSTAHRSVILARRWRDVGVGRAVGSYAGVTDVRMFTVDFGRRIY